MTGTDSISIPVYDIDADSVKNTLSEVEIAFNNRDYRRVSEFSSIVFESIQELGITLLDLRTYALGMQGKFDEAIKSAQRMVAYEPTLATGYLRLGDLYRVQGKQTKAIDAYDLGLQSASNYCSSYDQMVKNRESAVKRTRARVDFVARLPVEVVDDIIKILPNESKFVLLTVSSVWRNKIFRCSSVWKTLTSETCGSGATSLIQCIAAHVENLTISTKDRRVFLRYLLGLTGGNFSKIKSLTMDESAMEHITASMTMSLSGVFWQIRNTLTELVLRFNQDNILLMLVDLLNACSNLKSLEYSTPHRLSDTIGESVLLIPHNNLVNIHLKASSITGNDLQKLLPCCQQVQRLLLHGCDSTTLDVVGTFCPNLKTFGYNPSVDEIQRLDYLEDDRAVGLSRLYTSNGGAGVPASAILPLIRNNMHSLKILYGNISDQRLEGDLNVRFADLELKNLNKLTFWGGVSSGNIQQLLLRSISACTALTHVEAVECRDIMALVDALIALPQPEFLTLRMVELNPAKDIYDNYSRNTHEITHNLTDSSKRSDYETARR